MKITKTAYASLLIVALTVQQSAGARFSERFRNYILGTKAVALDKAPAEVFEIDRITRDCMACHDGVSASHVPVKSPGTPTQFVGIQTVNHTIGTDYAKRAAVDLRYAPLSSLPDGMRLVNGRVTCVTCHQLKSDAPQSIDFEAWDTDKQNACTASSKLTAGPKVADLCLTCHSGMR